MDAYRTKKSRVVVDHLRQRIASGELPVNSRIPTEAELSESLGVGRSSVREAVRALAQLGMLESAPSRGTFVRSRTPVPGLLSEVMRGFDPAGLLVLRRAVEVEAARRAAAAGSPTVLEQLQAAHAQDVAHEGDGGPVVERGRAPGHVHSLIMEMADEPALSAVYAGVLSAIRVAVGQGTIVRRENREDRHAEHGEIVAAIAARDAGAAYAAMAHHVDRDLAAQAGAPEPTSGT
ncbi:MAG: FadR/GntR family transcriptional regulator [Cellulomonadaceae bacterium]